MNIIRELRCQSSCHHHSNELLVIDVSITIDIGFSDHLIDLLICEFLSQVGHHMSEFCCWNQTISISIEHFEGFDELFFGVGVLHFSGHERQELWEVDCTVSISIDFVDHVLKFGFGWVLSQRSHDGTKLFGGDRAVTILIKKSESLLEFGNLLFVQLIGHLFSKLNIISKTF